MNFAIMDIVDLYILRILYNDRGAKIGNIALALHLSQPSISQRIKKIESALGKKIIERDGRYVKLTAFGIAACEKSVQSLNTLEEIKDIVNA